MVHGFSSNAYDDVSYLLSFVHIPMRFDDLFQLVAPVYHRLYLPCLDQLLQRDQVLDLV